MRILILSLALLAQGPLWAATAAKPPATCVNLTGNYVLPLGKHDRTDDPPILMIDQDHCRLISVVIGHGGFIPIVGQSSLDGTEGFFIVGDSIVQKGALTIPTANHGECSAQQVAMSLDADRNLLFTSPRVSGCADRYRGPLRDTFPRVGFKPAAVAESFRSFAAESVVAKGDEPSGPGWCMTRAHCESAGGMFAEDKKYCAPSVKSFLANSGKCFELPGKR